MLVCELLFNGILSGLAPEVQSHVTGIADASPAYAARVTPQEQVLASLLSCIVGDMKADKEGDGGNR
jgi:predicted LPLAT superfamily acyltransferase